MAVSARSSWSTTSSSPARRRAPRAATEEHETIEAGLVFRAIGYRGIPLPGVPFDERSGVIPNEGGRVHDPRHGERVPGEYVVGWIKRGPSGVIGTNKKDAQETVDAILADLLAATATAPRPPTSPPIPTPQRREPAARAPARARHLRGLERDRPPRARPRRARRPPAREAHARSRRCCAWQPPRAPRTRASRASRPGELARRRGHLPHCRPQAPLAHLVERRTFNPVGRVRVPHGALRRSHAPRASGPADRRQAAATGQGLSRKGGY